MHATSMRRCGKPTADDVASARLLASPMLLEPLDTLFVLDRYSARELISE